MKLSMIQAKQFVADVFNKYNGFNSVLPDDLLFSFAGNVRFNGWNENDLIEQFRLHFEIQSGKEFTIDQTFIK